MSQWINTILNALGSVFLGWAQFFIYFSLAVFFHYSRKMNAQVEPAGPALRPLTQWAKALQKKKPTAAEKQKKTYSSVKARRSKTAARLKQTDRLLYDKLRFLPDARTGQNLNFFCLFFVAVLVTVISILISNSETILSLTVIRDTELGVNPAAAAILRKKILFILLFVFSPSLSCFLIKKNREFYLDIFAFFVLVFLVLYKLFVCVPNECCIGIEASWGMFSPSLQTKVVPIQIIEFVTGALLSVLCVWFMLRSKHYRPGRGASAALLAYAVPRFLWEYLRYHGPAYRSAESQVIFLGFSTTQIVCIVLILTAIVWLFVLPLEKKLIDKLFVSITRHLPWYQPADNIMAAAPVSTAKGDGKT